MLKLSVREWRLARELSKERVAEELDMSVNTYTSREICPSEFTMGQARKLCALFEAPLDAINFFD